MWATLLPIILPAAISIVSYLYNQKMLSDGQMTSFLNYIQAMSSEPNFSEQAREAFNQMHIQLKAAHDQLKTSK